MCRQKRHGGIVESQLHIRRVRVDDFRRYKIVAENSVDTNAKDVTLYQSMIDLPSSMMNVQSHGIFPATASERIVGGRLCFFVLFVMGARSA